MPGPSPGTRPLYLAVAVTLLALGAATRSQAQDYPKLAPNTPALPGPPPKMAAPALPPGIAGDHANAVILPSLVGIRVLASIDGLSQVALTTPGLTIDGASLLGDASIRAKLAAFIGKPLTFGDLDRISHLVVSWYRDHDRPFMDVAFPEQDLSGGVLQVVVTEFRTGTVTVKGAKWYSNTLIRSELRLHAGEKPSLIEMNQDLAWLNRTSFRRVEIVAEKGKEPGTVDFVMNDADRFPVRVFAGYDNSGTPELGRDRWTLGFNWGNALWRDHELDYQFTSSDDFWHHREAGPTGLNDPTFVAHSLSYGIPLSWRDTLTFYGSYERALPHLGNILGLIGVSGEAGMKFTHSLPSTARYDQQIEVGYEFKTSNNNLEFGGEQVSNVTSEVDQFPLTYTGTLTDHLGQITVSDSIVISPGGLTQANNANAFEAQANSPDAKAHYLYDRLDVTRIMRLPRDLSWVFHVNGQISDAGLLPSEQVGLGGSTVRGFNDRVASGSTGFTQTQELRSPSFSLTRRLLNRDLRDESQLSAFWDYGVARQKGIVTAVPSFARASSLGLSLHAVFNRFVDAQIAYGWQVSRAPTMLSNNDIVQLSVTVAY